ncbi:uncharacterized protein LOC110830935 isoform X3 [Zootermopsis nevadensis]|uniref:uncharacterized protein LOC110830935 isoform X3 n=1 Tax=Zootermopsis nevadensis TaxID=136037 RepID=UPI000B8E74D5|nr:uncharacterized protein LOC110830935 isoform X3 [Zootermopsis nevadensis]
MSRGYYVPCAPFLYLVPDSGGAPPGMDCMPLQRSPGPFHYLIHEQAKSLVALQELQNEVGALLEFRDLVMETFPHLRNKMVASGVAGITSSNVSHTSSTPSSGTSNIPIPLTSSRRDWEPGIRVRRKIQSHTSAKDSEISVSSSLASNRGRISKTSAVHAQQPKSGEGINSGSGTSSAGSSAVQDSGFGTETSSSKDHCHSTTTGPVVAHRPAATASSPVVLDEAEDELWNLLDVIHRKGTKLREDVEYLQQRFLVSDRLDMLGQEEGDGTLRRRSLGDIEQQLVHESGKLCASEERERRLRRLKTGRSQKVLLDIDGESLDDGHVLGKLDSKRQARSEDDLHSLQHERDLLLDKVAEMETETLASRARASQLQTELDCLIEVKRDLEEQLRTAVSQKSELNSRIHDLHLQFVSGNKNIGTSSSVSPLSDTTARKLVVPGARRSVAVCHAVSSQVAYGLGSSPGRSQSCFTPVPINSRRLSEGVTIIKSPVDKNVTSPHLSSHSQDVGTSLSRQEVEDSVDHDKSEVSETQNAEERLTGSVDSETPSFKLGTLDGIVSWPTRIARITRGVTPDPHKVAAILREFSAVELQRHLLTTSVENKALCQRLDRAVKSHVDLVEQFEKIKDENDDLKFQLEEKSIELEGTRARVRVLERLQQKAATQDTAGVVSPEATVNSILPLLALPMHADDNIHHSSSTESAHDHTMGIQSKEGSSDQGDVKKMPQLQQMSPRRRPSKIPLPGTKSLCAPKPPSGRSTSVSSRNRGSPSLKSRTDSNSSLSGKNTTRESSWKNRNESSSSLTGGGKSRESPSGGRNSSLLGRNNSRDSLNSGSKSRESYTSTGKARGGDSLSGKKSNGDSVSSSVSKGRADTPSHQSSYSSNVSVSNRRESISSGKGKDTSFTSSVGCKGLHHQTPAVTRLGRGGSNNSGVNQRIGNGCLNERGDQSSKESGSPVVENTKVHPSQDIPAQQLDDTYPDSLNHLSSKESCLVAFKHQTNITTSNNYIASDHHKSVYQSSGTQAFPWHSSSSEYFDSINNSGSGVFQNSSILRSFSFYQDRYLQSSVEREGLAECDSLENIRAGIELNGITADTDTEDGNFIMSSASSRNLWMKADN